MRRMVITPVVGAILSLLVVVSQTAPNPVTSGSIPNRGFHPPPRPERNSDYQYHQSPPPQPQYPTVLEPKPEYATPTLQDYLSSLGPQQPLPPVHAQYVPTAPPPPPYTPPTPPHYAEPIVTHLQPQPQPQPEAQPHPPPPNGYTGESATIGKVHETLMAILECVQSKVESMDSLLETHNYLDQATKHYQQQPTRPYARNGGDIPFMMVDNGIFEGSSRVNYDRPSGGYDNNPYFGEGATAAQIQNYQNPQVQEYAQQIQHHQIYI